MSFYTFFGKVVEMLGFHILSECLEYLEGDDITLGLAKTSKCSPSAMSSSPRSSSSSRYHEVNKKEVSRINLYVTQHNYYLVIVVFAVRIPKFDAYDGISCHALKLRF